MLTVLSLLAWVVAVAMVLDVLVPDASKGRPSALRPVRYARWWVREAKEPRR